MSNNNIRNKSLRLRIYPNSQQEILISKTFGCCRLIYNLHLNERLKFYENNVKDIKDKNKRIEILKTFKPKSEKEWKEEYPFMKEVSSQSLQQSRINCDNAFNNFFSKRTRFPKFKSKKNNHQSYRECMNIHIYFERQKIKIPKMDLISFRNKPKPKWFNQVQALKSITIEKTPSGKYFAVCLFEIENNVYKVENREKSIGLDFSPSECYVDSNGQTGKDFNYIPQKQKNRKVLRKYQRQLARKTKGSNNYRKARIKLSRVEEYIANCRKDWIEKETLRLVTSYDKVVVEDLNLKGISKFLTNAKNMNDTSWGMFTSRLEQKGQDYSCNVIKADRWFPSSQLCSNCGYQYHELTLDMREWSCPICHKHHIRDVNAAINLKNYVPSERGKLMPVEDIEGTSDLVSEALEYPVKQEADNF